MSELDDFEYIVRRTLAPLCLQGEALNHYMQEHELGDNHYELLARIGDIGNLPEQLADDGRLGIDGLVAMNSIREIADRWINESIRSGQPASALPGDIWPGLAQLAAKVVAELSGMAGM